MDLALPPRRRSEIEALPLIGRAWGTFAVGHASTGTFANRFGASIRKKGAVMAGKMDQAKGRAKEAAGALTDDDKLRREGKIDQAAGKVKEAAKKAVDKVNEAARRVNDDS